MKYVDEYRDGQLAKNLSKEIRKKLSRPWTIMEICGGQTHSIMKYNLEELLPEALELVHGPGCPVCVTPLNVLDKAMHIAALPGVIFTSFGDMLRVPGSNQDLLSVKAAGGDVRMVYSPLDAVELAFQNPDRQVVFLAVGFETTAPPNALAVQQAARRGLKNFSILTSHVLVPPAMEAILSSPTNRIQGFLAAGHVCTVMGYEEYIPIAKKYATPVSITGFEPVDILHGILSTVEMLEAGHVDVVNQYSRVVKREGNLKAKALLKEVFTVCDRTWRGIGSIPMSGFRLSDTYCDFDAELRFNVGHFDVHEPEVCIAGEVLQGLKKPFACPAFATECTPEHPLGAPMVSSEGACSAYYRYRNKKQII